ncbi:MAG: DUF2125 domain-containing protein [Limimaricola sp.]|uniref:DUF2125 domain-containing protein n=1 Tax=Limimaricola sp. TaxID=2211665 RepID=UPI001D3CE6D4|nr:DUF2125 domain-containing protein [Limimaricola sp.]MBI1417782.1 DUF2125 domain-containing protein [Limimaricola sp.]
MRRLLIVVLVLAGLYGGYWFVGAFAVERQGRALLGELAADGWQVGFSDLKTVGFPSRFDTTLSDPALADPKTGIGWKAAFFQLLALSYQPNHLIAIWPDSQTLTLPGQRVAVQAQGMKASVSVAPTPALRLDRLTAEVGVATATSDKGWQAEIDHALFALRPSGAPQGYDLYADVVNLRLPAEVLDVIDPGKALPEPIADMHVDSTVTFDRPLDRHAVAGTPPRPTGIAVKSVQAHWGDLALNGAGNLTIDTSGQLSGSLDLTLSGWPQIVKMLVGAGLIAPQAAPLWTALGARADGAVKLTLRLADGRMMLGPLPLGPAPRLF